MNTTIAGVSSPKRLARIAGLLYLIVGIFGGFAVAYVTPMLYVPGDAATTAGNVVANAGLVRISVLADLLQATVFVFLAMTLYLLLRHVHKNVAAAMLILVAIATTIMCIDKVFQFGALRVAGDASYAAVFGVAGSNALVLLLLDMHNYGYLIAQIFFGLWLVPLGYLAYQVRDVPQSAGRRARRGGRLLPGGRDGGVPGSRIKQTDPRFPGHRTHDRGDLAARIPAHSWSEDREVRRAHPYRHSVNVIARSGRWNIVIPTYGTEECQMNATQ